MFTSATTAPQTPSPAHAKTAAVALATILLVGLVGCSALLGLTPSPFLRLLAATSALGLTLLWGARRLARTTRDASDDGVFDVQGSIALGPGQRLHSVVWAGRTLLLSQGTTGVELLATSGPPNPVPRPDSAPCTDETVETHRPFADLLSPNRTDKTPAPKRDELASTHTSSPPPPPLEVWHA